MSQERVTIKSITSYVLVFGVGVLLSGICVRYWMNMEALEYINSNMFEELNDKFEVIDALKAEEKYSERVRGVYDDQLKENLLLLAITNPIIEEYPATSKAGLCKLIQYSNENNSFLDGTTELDDTMRNYLKNSKSTVMSEMKKSQRWSGGQGCETTGAGGECIFKDKSRCGKRHNQALKEDAKNKISAS